MREAAGGGDDTASAEGLAEEGPVVGARADLKAVHTVKHGQTDGVRLMTMCDLEDVRNMTPTTEVDRSQRNLICLGRFF